MYKYLKSLALPKNPLFQSFHIGLLSFILAGSFSIAELEAQSPYMQEYSVADGLPSSNIYTVTEDRLGYLWIGTDKGLVRFDGYRFKVFNLLEENGSNEVWQLAEDRDGKIWCATFNNLLYYDNDQVYTVPLPDSIDSKMVDQYFINDNGNPYVRMRGINALYEIITEDSIQLKRIDFPKLPNVEKYFNFSFIRESLSGEKWFSAQNSKSVYIIKSLGDDIEIVQRYISSSDQYYSKFEPFVIADSKIIFFSNSELLVYDYSSFVRISYKERFGEVIELEHYQKYADHCVLYDKYRCLILDTLLTTVLDLDFLNHKRLNSVFKDKRGNLWLSTPSSGLRLLSRNGLNSRTFSNAIGENSLITSFALDNENNLWFGLSDGNLAKADDDFNVTKFELNFTSDFSQKSGRAIRSIALDDKGNLIVQGESGFLLSLPKEQIEKGQLTFEYSQQSINLSDGDELKLINEKNLQKICGVEIGSPKSLNFIGVNQFLVSSSAGDFSITKNDSGFEIQEISNSRSYSSDYFNGTYWIGKKDGLFSLHSSHAKSNLTKVEPFNFSISDVEISSEGQIWIASEGNGLFRLQNESIDTIFELRNPEEVISQLIEDNHGNIWCASNFGIAKITPMSEAPFAYDFKRFLTSDGLPAREVKQIYVNEGKLYALSANGLSVLSDQFSEEKQIPRIPKLTNFEVNNEPQRIQSTYHLNSTANNLTFEFSTMLFENLDKTLYRFQLLGAEDKLRESTNSSITYNTLSPGFYEFSVRSVNELGDESPELQVPIRIFPPWYLSNIAYVIYIALVLSLLYLFFHLQFKRKLANQKMLELEESERRKNIFYSNITHEFKTPLTLILGSAENLREDDNLKGNISIQMIKKHGSRLLYLLNQMLELSKSNDGQERDSYANDNIVFFIHQTVSSFREFSKTKEISLNVQSDIDALQMKFDPGKLQTILYNLLSNALKFTPYGGTITVTTYLHKKSSKGLFNFDKDKNSWFVVSVQDSGVGIPEDEISNIFDRFYSVESPFESALDSGTGIGLALTKQLVEHFGGKIEVVSTEGYGSTFKVYLPIEKSLEEKKVNGQVELPFDMLAYEDVYDGKSFENEQSKNNPTLLIVEDDTDMRNYLHSLLIGEYNVHVAENGKEGVEMAFELIPDIIVSDVLMPKTSGFNLCRSIKEDIRTSHIPIILLTAKSNKKDRLDGLSYGADAFITKPFDKTELFIRLQKLYNLRLVLQKRYSQQPSIVELAKLENESFKKEDEFITKLSNFIEENIDNVEMNVDKICRAMGMSRTPLHKKIVALTGESITKYVKKFRLRKAEQLLLDSDLSIFEVAESVGMDANYFTKAFLKLYGVTPSKYRKEKLTN
ncbi:MAG: ATP-binding protein [Bacteroidota bacterium]